MRTLLALLCVASISACGDLNNTDLLFLAALPDSELVVDAPAQDGQALTLEQPLGKRDWRRIDEARDTALGINAFTSFVGEAITSLTRRAPTERAEGRRVWGPFSVRQGKAFMKVEMTKEAAVDCPTDAPGAPVGPGFRWKVLGAKKVAGEYLVLVDGRSRGSFAAESCGAFEIDFDASDALGNAAKTFDVAKGTFAWANGVGLREIEARFSPRARGKLLSDARYAFRHDLQADARRFQFDLTETVLRGTTEEERRLTTAIQWRGTGGPGRSDVVIQPLAGKPAIAITACWNAQRTPTLLRNPLPGAEEIAGDEATACAFRNGLD